MDSTLQALSDEHTNLFNLLTLIYTMSEDINELMLMDKATIPRKVEALLNAVEEINESTIQYVDLVYRGFIVKSLEFLVSKVDEGVINVSREDYERLKASAKRLRELVDAPYLAVGELVKEYLKTFPGTREAHQKIISYLSDQLSNPNVVFDVKALALLTMYSFVGPVPDEEKEALSGFIKKVLSDTSRVRHQEE